MADVGVLNYLAVHTRICCKDPLAFASQKVKVRESVQVQQHYNAHALLANAILPFVPWVKC